MGRTIFSVPVLVAALVAALIPAAARADGLPVLGIDVGTTGVASSSDGARYVTIPEGSRTIVEQIAQHGGQVLAWRSVRGTFTIPAVAYDGSAGGLSADGTTLVLIEPRASFPRATTKLVVMNSDGLKPLRVVKLQGDFSFDAVSPKGSWLYFIHYVSPNDPTRYLVQAYDVLRGRLLAKPIIDPDEPGEKMRGNPLSRTMSADGRWVSFDTKATNFNPADTGGDVDIYVKDLQTGAVDQASVQSGGGQATGTNGASIVGGDSTISADGRFVSFWSDASTLVPNDNNGSTCTAVGQTAPCADVFVHDRQTNTTVRITSTNGVEGDGDSYSPALSMDGKFVAIDSKATTLDTSGGGASNEDIFVHVNY